MPAAGEGEMMALTGYERELIQEAMNGNWKRLNEMEFKALKRLADKGQFKPITDISGAFNLIEFVTSETGKMNGLVWSSASECDFCDGTGEYTVFGNKRDVDIECPDCDGTGMLPDGDEITTDLEGKIQVMEVFA